MLAIAFHNGDHLLRGTPHFESTSPNSSRCVVPGFSAVRQVKYPEGRNPSLDDDARYTKLVYGITRLQDWITGRALVYLSLRGQFAASNRPFTPGSAHRTGAVVGTNHDCE